MALIGYPQSEPFEAVKPTKKGQARFRPVLGATKTIRKDRSNRKIFTALLFGDAASRQALVDIVGDVVCLGEGSYFVVSVVRSRSFWSCRRTN